jgi:glycerophosphoryl diester phosphodiesterase
LFAVDKVIGHRGAAAYAPENTMAAFNHALNLGCRFIEFDVMCSADGQPFVIHDEQLKRTTNGRGEVGLVDAAYLQGLDAGSWFAKRYLGEVIPHLKEVIQWLNATDIQANIEIKPYQNQVEQTTIAVLTHVHRYWSAQKAPPLISSFSWDALVLCRSIAPEMPLGLLLDRWDERWLEKAQQLGCYSIHCNKRLLTADRVAVMKEQGYVLCAYTVNSKRQANKLYRLGVDAVFSDYPDLLA